MARAASPGAGGKAASGSKRKAKRAQEVGASDTKPKVKSKRKTASKTKPANAGKAAGKTKSPRNVKAPSKSKIPAKAKSPTKERVSTKKARATRKATTLRATKAKSASKSKLASARKAKAAAQLKPRAQYAALPFRLTGAMEILLVTSRETARWVIPKGWPIRGKSRRATAAAEARQEAGLLGEIGKTPLGQYDYIKFLKTGVGLPCRVTVFPLLVTGHKLRWREQTQRSAQWFDPATAAQNVQEPQLAEIIRRFADDYLALARALAGTPQS